MWKYKSEDKDIITNSYYMISLFMKARENKSLEDLEHYNLQIITNLKLQVLMYLSEAYYMYLYNKEMFDSEWYAWNYCPANKELYNKYNYFGSEELIVSEKDIKRANKLPQENKDVIDFIYNLFGDFSAFDLVCIMHTKETPLMTILTDYDDKDFCSISEIKINKKETKKWFNEGIMLIIGGNEEMKVTMYELLGLVKDGKAPLKFKTNNRIYEYDKNRGYICRYIGGWIYLFEGIDMLKCLNDEVEIIEDTPKEEKELPEKIEDILRIDDLIPPVDENMHKIWIQTIKNHNKINEICDYLEYLKSKGE